jgi:hypothetical protein
LVVRSVSIRSELLPSIANCERRRPELFKIDWIYDADYLTSTQLKANSSREQGSPFCYFHARTRVDVPARKPSASQSLELPPLENSAAIHAALHAILNALANLRIKPSAAGKLLYGLQLAQKTLEDSPPRHVPSRAIGGKCGRQFGHSE